MPTAVQTPSEPLADVPHDRRPRHVAIIMDGNGRWAQRRHLPRIEGHRRGVASVRRDGASVEILSSDAERVLKQLFARDPDLSSLEVSGAGLEEAFLNLTSAPAAGAPDVAAAGGSR